MKCVTASAFSEFPKGYGNFFICDDISCIHVFTFRRNIYTKILFRVRWTLLKKDLDFRGTIA